MAISLPGIIRRMMNFHSLSFCIFSQLLQYPVSIQKLIHCIVFINSTSQNAVQSFNDTITVEGNGDNILGNTFFKSSLIDTKKVEVLCFSCIIKFYIYSLIHFNKCSQIIFVQILHLREKHKSSELLQKKKTHIL